MDIEQIKQTLMAFAKLVNDRTNKYQVIYYIDYGKNFKVFENCFKTNYFDSTETGVSVDHVTDNDQDCYSLTAVYCGHQFKPELVNHIEYNELDNGNLELNIEYRQFESAEVSRRKFILSESLDLQNVTNLTSMINTNASINDSPIVIPKNLIDNIFISEPDSTITIEYVDADRDEPGSFNRKLVISID